ncbi:MAG: SufD family Fe-S cluster assembly protein [Patescibacteria group bacterium]|nr:SufD family Fe-S cluster assembly protein [Patescibacteria group bacterium]
MKNVKNAHYKQIDHKIETIIDGAGYIILPITMAYKQFSFVRDHFENKPEEGYFVWVKKQGVIPLITNISICSPNIFQKPRNLIVIENGAKAEMTSICNAGKMDLAGKHKGHSKIILKENSELKLNHSHSWGNQDIVSADLEVFSDSGSKFTYSYRCVKTPKEFSTQNNIYLQKDASANLVFTVLAQNSNVDMHDTTYLNGKNSKGVSRIRLISNNKGNITARSKMIANKAGTGHVDCMGLLLSDNATIHAIPELINQDKNASLTHEASVGRISDEVLNYLRTRGLNEDEAINLVVAGFLGDAEPVVIKGKFVKSELNM